MDKILLVLLVTLLKLSTAFAANNILANTFTSDLYRYSIHYPSDWKIAEHGNGVVVFTGHEVSSKEIFTVNIQTIYTKKGGGKYKTIKDLMDDFRIQVPMHTQQANFLDRNSFNLIEPDGTNLSGEQTTLTFKENGKIFKQWQVMLMSKDGILFQAWAYRSPVQFFDANRALAASMLSSWVIN